jgi:hypothetical protein
MAREFAQIKLAIWADDDWRDLSPLARYLYLTLLTSPTLSHCGVADWRPARIGSLNGMDPADVEAFGAELIEALYLVVDEESEEVLIRSFIRNDGLMKQPKMAVAMASAHAGVASRDIRGVVVHELRRLRTDFPNLHGWGSEKAADLLGMRSVDPSTYPLGKGNRTPIGKGSPTPAPTPATNTSRLSPSADADESDRFDEFWDTYDKKVGRKKAEQRWTIALRKPHITADLLIAAAASYIAWQTAEGKHPTYTKDPSTWLNGEHWADERMGRAAPQTRVGQHLALVAQLAAEEQAALELEQ